MAEEKKENAKETVKEEKPKEEPKKETEAGTPSPVSQAQPQSTPQQTTATAQPKKSNTWLICCGCGCGCVVVVIILIMIGWMFNFFGAVGGAGGASEIFNDWRAGTLYSATPGPK